MLIILFLFMHYTGMDNVEMFGVMRQVTETGMENVENLGAKVMDSFLIYC